MKDLIQYITEKRKIDIDSIKYSIVNISNITDLRDFTIEYSFDSLKKYIIDQFDIDDKEEIDSICDKASKLKPNECFIHRGDDYCLIVSRVK
jgi:hypothetical protein